jgi:uncharacterized protein with ParB-like and HNH nuclease domain
MPLQEEIDKTRQEIRTDGYLMSIGEWISLYENNEIDIHPDFQRFFRWSDHQKSTFIESILLGIPIPPIFVSQRNDGVWDVVDGVQRLSTIYEFVGLLKTEDREQNKNNYPVALQKTTYLPSLEGKKWDDPNDPDNSLTQTQRLLIKRAKIAVNIVEKESDEMVKYELFQRLNTGGAIATPQEVRNCILVMLNKDLYELMRSLADYESFRSCIALSDRLYEEQYDMELVLRFILLFNKEFNKDEKEPKQLGGDVSVFLTEGMREMAVNKELNYSHIKEAFIKTFDVLNKALGDDSFKRYKPEQDRFLGGFLLSAYEVIALGIGYNYKNLPQTDRIPDLIKSIWSNETYQKWSGAGVNAARRLPYLVPLGREVFSG